VQVSDLIVGETTCDGKKKMYEILSEYAPVYVLEVPNKKSKKGRELWLEEVKIFKDVVEKLTGKKVTAANLKKAIAMVNDRRRVSSGFIIYARPVLPPYPARTPCWRLRSLSTTTPNAKSKW